MAPHSAHAPASAGAGPGTGLAAAANAERRAARDWALVIALTLAGAAIRLATMTTRGVWLDEAISVVQTTQSMPDLLASLVGGVHPPLFHILMHYWTQAFGAGEIAVRSFACVWGVAAIPAAFWAGRTIYDRRVGLLTAALVTFSPYLSWYSQEARMYSMAFFFALMSLGWMERALKDQTPGSWVLYGVFTGLGMLTHYFFLFVIAGEVAYYLLAVVLRTHLARVREDTSVFAWRRPLKIFEEIGSLRPWLLSMGVLAALFLLWLQRSVFVKNIRDTSALVSSAAGEGLGYGQVGPSLAWRFNDVGRVIVEMLAGFHRAPAMYAMVAMWPLIISLLLVLTDFMRPIGTRSMLPPITALGVVVIALLGQWQGQVLASRYFIAVAAPVFLLAAAVLANLPRHVRMPVIAFVLAVSIALLGSQYLDPENDMRDGSREVIAQVARGYQPGDAVIYEPFYMNSVIRYYMPRTIPTYAFPQYGVNAGVRRDKVKLIQDLDRVSGNSRHVWLILGYQDVEMIAGDAYNTLRWFERNGYQTLSHTELNGVELYRFEAPEDRVQRMRGPQQ